VRDVWATDVAPHLTMEMCMLEDEPLAVPFVVGERPDRCKLLEQHPLRTEIAKRRERDDCHHTHATSSNRCGFRGTL
jgi:hypothetical protein